MDVASWGAPEEESAWSAPQFFSSSFPRSLSFLPLTGRSKFILTLSAPQTYKHTGLLTTFFYIFVL